MQIRFQPDAEAELAEAHLWYSLQREGRDMALMHRIGPNAKCYCCNPAFISDC